MESKKTLRRALVAALALAALLALPLMGCGGGSGSGGGDGTKTVTDDAGRTVEVPADIQSYLPAGNPAQLCLFALDPDECIGLAQELNENEAKYFGEDFVSLDYVGSIYGSKGDINAEAVAALNPDVIIDVGEPKEGIAGELDALQEQVGIPVLHYDCAMDQMGECFTKLGDLLDMEKEAAKLADYLDDAYATCEAFDGNENKVSALYCLGEQGLNVVAKGTFHSQVFDAMFDNLAVVDDPSSKGTGNEVDMEQLYNWDPQVIFFAPDSVYDQVGGNADWQQLQAIANGDYYKVPLGPLNWVGFPPSIQRVLGMYWMGSVLYPDLADYDLYDKVSEYFDLFYHYDLSQDEFNAIVDQTK